MGELIHLNFKPSRPKFVEPASSSVLTADFVHGQSNRTLYSVLYNVGFEDPLYWRVPKPFRHNYTYRGLIASPDLLATKAPDQVRLIKMLDGPKPEQLDDHSVFMVNLDAWVLAAKLRWDRQRVEMWVVFDDGGRFELQPEMSLAGAHAELAMREMRVEGLHELSTSEAATMVLEETLSEPY